MQTGNETEKDESEALQKKEKHLPSAGGALRRGAMTKIWGRWFPGNSDRSYRARCRTGGVVGACD